METLLVYGLVFVFFVLLIPVIYFLMHDPLPHANEDSANTAANISKTRARTKIQSERTISYSILAALFALMFVLTIVVHRTKA